MPEQLKQVLIERIKEKLIPGSFSSTEHVIEIITEVLESEEIKELLTSKQSVPRFKEDYPTLKEILEEIDND